MKIFFLILIALVLFISASFVGFGIFINSTSDNYIETMMKNRIIRLRGAKVAFRELAAEISVPYLNLQGRDIVDAITQIEGTVVDLFIKRDSQVQKGDRICQILNSEFPLQLARANTSIAKAEAAHIKAKSDMERKMKLAEKNAISKSEAESSVALTKTAKAELDSAKIVRGQIEQKQDFQTVTAPAAGAVLLIYHDKGSFVSAGSPIALVGDLDALNVNFLIPDEKLQNLLPIEDSYSLVIKMSQQTEEKAFGNFKGVDNESSFDMRFMSILPKTEERSITRNVACEIDNPAGVLEPGIYLDVIIKSKQAKKVLCIPVGALEKGRSGEEFVSVANADSNLEHRRVKTGYYNDRFIQITEGLNEGDTVINSVIYGDSAIPDGTKIEVIIDE